MVMNDNHEPNPLEILEKGYRATLREQWGKAWAKRGWKALPRIVIGTLGFTAGYIILYLWDGWQWWKHYFEERSRRDKDEGSGRP